MAQNDDDTMNDDPSSNNPFPRHFSDPLLKQLSVEWLNPNGYVNLTPLSKATDVDNDFAADVTLRRTARHALHLGEGEPLPIHPIFREECWRNLTHPDYERVYPAMLMASRMLDEPTVLPFFKGLLRPVYWQKIDDILTRHLDGLPRYSFRALEIENRQEALTIWQQLAAMRDCVRWEFVDKLPVDNVDNVWAVCCTDRTLPGLELGCTGSAIRIDAKFLHVLTGQATVSHIFESWNPGTHDESATLRTWLFTAVILLHEFTHALWESYLDKQFEHDENGILHMLTRAKPYYRDHRKAETGHAFEDKILSGVMAPIGLRHPVACYGLRICRWPGIVPAHPHEEQLGSAALWGTRWTTHYAIAMDWVWSLYKKRFWDNDILAYGLKALSPPKVHGVRVRNTHGIFGATITHNIDGSPVSSKEGDDVDGLVLRDENTDRMEDITLH